MTIDRPTLWTAAVAATALIGSYGLACVFPFAALATIAALTLPRGRAFGLTLAVWGANQAVGYAFLHYPHTLDTAMLGAAIGAGVLAATLVARLVARDASLTSPRAFAALACGFAVYEAIQLAAATIWGGLDTFAAHIVGGMLLNDFGWYLMLAGLHLLLARRGAAREALLPA